MEHIEMKLELLPIEESAKKANRTNDLHCEHDAHKALSQPKK